MSYPELRDWNPMEEEYRKNFAKSSDRNILSDTVDPLCLYVRQIPVDLTEEDFISLMSGEDRRLTTVKLNKNVHPNSSFTYGFAHFATHNEASRAMKELNGIPPLYMNMTFANKKKENRDCSNIVNHQPSGKGRGMSTSVNHPKHNQVNCNFENTRMPSLGRGKRICLDGPISAKLKVTTESGERKVIVGSPVKKPASTTNGQFLNAVQNAEDTKTHRLSVSPEKSHTKKTDAIVSLVPSPFYFCFLCGKEGRFSCRYCKKPYCSRNCQTSDSPSHQEICKKAKGVADSLLCLYKNTLSQGNDSSYVSENSNSDYEKSDNGPIAINKNKASQNVDDNFEVHKSVEKLFISQDQVEMVSIINVESPSQFWIHLAKFSSDFLNMEKKLTLEQKDLKPIHAASCIEPQLNCCTLYNSSICRAEVLKVKSQHEILICLLDYGKTVTVQKTALYNLPAEFTKLPMQAVACRMVDGAMNKSIKWSSEDTLSFQLHTSNKKFKARFVRCCNHVYDVSLINQDGISLYSIMLSEEKEVIPKAKAEKGIIPKCEKKEVLHKHEKEVKTKQRDVVFVPKYKEEKEVIPIYKKEKEVEPKCKKEKEVMPKYKTEKEVISKTSESQAFEIDGPPSSVWSKLKVGDKMILLQSIVSDNCIWCYLLCNLESDLPEILDIEKLLTNYSGEDVAMCAEEGDFAAGFSNEYKQFYRCILLKRKQQSFLVRYIDYGNEEEITSLRSLSPELYQKCCYLVKCEKPSSLSIDDFQNFLGDSGAEVTVLKTDKNAAEISFNLHKQYTMACYPCYPSSENAASDTEVYTTTTNNFTSASSQKAIDYKVIAEKIMSQRILSPATKYTIRVLFIKTVSEVFVIPIDEEAKMNEMVKSLNSVCNTENTSHVANIGEIVSCRYTVDKAWYRGQVIEKMNNNYKVFFVDYGNVEIVSQEDIQVLPDKFIAPQFSMRVSLSGMKNEDVSEQILDKLRDEVWDMKVIHAKKTPFEVMLFQKDHALTEMISSKVNRKNKSNLKFQKLPAKASIKICFEDDKYLYVQQVKDLKPLEEMILKLKSNSEFPIPKKPTINGVYSGLCSDGLWYRVSIEEEVSVDKYKVFFLDFGNFETVSINGLRELPDDLFSCPVYCSPVLVQGRVDLNLNMEDEYAVEVIGTREQMQEVKFLLPQEKTKKLPHISEFKKQKLEDGLSEVILCYMEGGIIYCQLSSDSDNVVGMFKQLQQCGEEGKTPSFIAVGDVVCAQSSDNSWYRACVLSDQKAPSYKVLFFDYGNSEEVSRDCIKVLPDLLTQLPIFAIPVKIENMNNIKDDTFYTEAVLVRKIKEINGDTYVVEIQVEHDTCIVKSSALKRLELPSDCISNVTLCHIEDSLYYVQPTANADNLLKLEAQLSEAESFNNLSHSVAEDDVICAKFSDSKWYRCAVQKVYPDKIKVSFIDYGNTDFVSVEDLKLLPLELSSFSVACIPIRVKDEVSLQNKICEEITTFDVKICSMNDNIPMVDIVPESNAVDKLTETVLNVSYNPVFLTFFQKTSLLLMECCKVIFKKHVDNLYIVIRPEDEDDMKKLSSLLQDSETSTISHLPSVNEVLLAKSTTCCDNLWSRCCILENVSEDICKVFFVDVGITEDIEVCAIRYLPENIKSYPLFAIKVSVESKEPITLEKCYNIQALEQNDDIFRVQVYHQYMYTSISRKELLPNTGSDVIFCHKETDKLFLQIVADIEILAEIQTALLECLSRESIIYKPEVGELVCAMSQLDDSWYRGCIEEVITADKYKVLFIDYGNTEIVQKDRLQAIPFALTKFPSLCVLVSFQNEEVNESIELQKVYSVIAESNASSNIQVIKFSGSEDMSGSEGSSAVVPVSCTQNHTHEDSKKFLFISCKSVPFNPGEQDIVIYNVDENIYLYCAPYDLDNIQANMALPALLTEHCESKGLPFDNREPEVGEMVIALYSEDNNWYRATVLEKSHPMYDVNFVDYGNDERVNVSFLRKMEEQFMELDVQTHLCSLSGFTAPDENLEKVYDELKKFIVFSNPEPLKAVVKITKGDITVNIPKITSQLVQLSLVTPTND